MSKETEILDENGEGMVIIEETSKKGLIISSLISLAIGAASTAFTLYKLSKEVKSNNAKMDVLYEAVQSAGIERDGISDTLVEHEEALKAVRAEVEAIKKMVKEKKPNPASENKKPTQKPKSPETQQ